MVSGVTILTPDWSADSQYWPLIGPLPRYPLARDIDLDFLDSARTSFSDCGMEAGERRTTLQVRGKLSTVYLPTS